MAVRVLIVDDSGFFRRRISEILATDKRIEVVGMAADGMEAIRKVAELKPDVVTMDIEMPVLDGISAVRRIMATRPTPILMFSSLTSDGAKAALDALDAGAVDYLPKRLEDLSQDQAEAARILCARVRTIGLRGMAGRVVAPRVASVTSPAPVKSRLALPPRGSCRIVLIGTSTGGPAALQQVLSKLPADYPVPLLLIQHMPGSFTPAFAERLNQLCAITVKEAAEGDVLRPGTALLAPGGRQMVVEDRRGSVLVHIIDSEPGQNYRPCVDITFISAAKAYPGKALAVVMTGMGADGRDGARALKQSGSYIWAQDESSCVVYGMPMAVAEAGLVDQVLPLSDIGPSLAQGI
jgi:two-component system, chemotaxis family, protein-glutamate methylesterase/glutaminase